MTTKEMIAVARKCGDRTTKCKDCAMFEYDANCISRLLNMFADRMEMALECIPRSCTTCWYESHKLSENPCCDCNHDKWIWRGEDNG